jgi:hypothetical protein
VAYIHNEVLWLFKKMKSCHCGKMGGTWGHYAKWNKPDTKYKYFINYPMCGW